MFWNYSYLSNHNFYLIDYECIHDKRTGKISLKRIVNEYVKQNETTKEQGDETFHADDASKTERDSTEVNLPLPVVRQMIISHVDDALREILTPKPALRTASTGDEGVTDQLNTEDTAGQNERNEYLELTPYRGPSDQDTHDSTDTDSPSNR